MKMPVVLSRNRSLAVGAVATLGASVLWIVNVSARGDADARPGPMRELGPGEVDDAPPGIEHWHGAAPDEGLVHLGVIPLGGSITFTEPVSDAEYNGETL